jgi:hypothetical protein
MNSKKIIKTLEKTNKFTDKSVDKPADTYEDSVKRAKLERFKTNLNKLKLDNILNNYQLLGTIREFNFKKTVSKKKGKDKDKKDIYNFKTIYDFNEYYMDERLQNYINFGIIEKDEILNENTLKDGFKCVCKKKLQKCYIIKHIEHKYILIVGICCYKAIREDKTNETLCALCNNQIITKKYTNEILCNKCKLRPKLIKYTLKLNSLPKNKRNSYKKKYEKRKIKQRLDEEFKILEKQYNIYGEYINKSGNKWYNTKYRYIDLKYIQKKREQYYKENSENKENITNLIRFCNICDKLNSLQEKYKSILK